MPAILTMVEKYGPSLIEDTAHAPGAWLNGQTLGTWGEIGCFSFFSNKNLSTGEGGMFLPESAERTAFVDKLKAAGI